MSHSLYCRTYHDTARSKLLPACWVRLYDQFQILDSDVPRSTSYGVYISQLIRFARASNHVADSNTCNTLTQKLLKQDYQYHKLRKTFSKF